MADDKLLSSKSLTDVSPDSQRKRVNRTTGHGKAVAGSEQRSKSAPPSSHAGRRLLTSRTKSQRCMLDKSDDSQMQPVSGQQTSKERNVTTPNRANNKDTHATITVVETPSYTLCRSPSRIHMSINTSTFFGDKVNEASGSNQHPQVLSSLRSQSSDITEARKALENSIIAQEAMQREIAEMRLRLEHQREHYEEQIEQLKKDFGEESLILTEKNDITMSKVKEDHANELQKLHKMHLEEVQDMRRHFESEIKTLQVKLESMREDQLISRAGLLTEAEYRLQERECELTEQHRTELEQQAILLKAEAQQDEESLRRKLEKQYESKLDTFVKAHMQEKEDLMSKFMDTVKLDEELKKRKKLTEKREREISKLKQELEAAVSQQITTEIKLLDMQEECEALQRDFKLNVQKVDEQFRSRLDSLMQENSQLRSQIIHKTEEFWRYRTAIEKSQAQVLQNFGSRMKVVVQARRTASLSIAASVEENDGDKGSEVRPTSAPVTTTEVNFFKTRAN